MLSDSRARSSAPAGMASALVVLPNSGHTINIEEPEAFNQAVNEFLTQVTAGRWPHRDPGSTGGSILGIDGGKS